MGSDPHKPLFYRFDRWTEVLGPVLKPSWVRLEGIPLHAWDVKAFHLLGEILGVLLEIDEAAAIKQRIDILIRRDPQRLLTKIIALHVNRVRFHVIVIEKDERFWPESYQSLVRIVTKPWNCLIRTVGLLVVGFWPSIC